MKKVIPDESLELMFIDKTDSYPDYYLISLFDKNPENPTVYTTNHKLFLTN